MPDNKPSINRDRLLDRLAVLSEIGGIDGTKGSSRLALTDADKEGRELVLSWMRDLGLKITIDGVGNTVAVLENGSGLAPVMMGSHIDTVKTGGRYDGNLGVLAGLEVIETIITNKIDTKHPVGVGFFTNEEGARFAPDMMGSLVYVGAMSVEEAHGTVGIDGATVGEELERIGFLGSGPNPGETPHAFVELHIEQGPVLEEAGIQIGVVEGVQGISWTELTITGQSNHAGTTPMRLRRDAGFAAARITTFVRHLVNDIGHPQVGTVGALTLSPNLINVVAASATMTVDLRNTDEAILKSAEESVESFCQELAESEGVTIEARTLARFEPVAFDPGVVDLVEATAKGLGLSTLRMPSGAGHDAQMLARVCPTSMIFTPSHEGISHNPAEHTSDEDLAAGATVLLNVVLALASGERP